MSDNNSLPLSGIRVIDLTQVQMGPLSTQMLADFGADVIKIERPKTGDITRTVDPYAEGVEDSASYISLNRNKRSIALDLKAPEASEVLDSLLADADVLVMNFKGGGAERLGLDYDELHARFPRLIYASGTGFGNVGPLSKAGGQDMVVQSITGASWHNRDANGRPSLYPVPFIDFATGMSLTQGILLAILQRQTTGEGQRVDVSLFDTALYTQMQEYSYWLQRQVEIDWEDDYLVGSFRTSDGWISVVGLFRPEPLQDICNALQVENLSNRPEFATLSDQLANRSELFAELDKIFASFTTSDAVATLTEAGILCGPVMSYEDVVAHPHTAASERLRSFNHPTMGTVTTVDNPINLSGVTQRPFRASPLLGEHTAEVLQEISISSKRVDQLLEQGIVEQAKLPATVRGK